MMTPDQIRAAMASNMRWKTPSGAQSVPGYGGEFQHPAMPPAPPQFMPAGGIPSGYAEMFAGPIEQPRGLMDMAGQASQEPGVAGTGEPMGLMDAMGMAGRGMGMSGGAEPMNLAGMFGRVSPPTAPVPRQRPADTYTIRKGDTMTAIAKRHGTTVKALMAKNPQIKNADRIAAGAKIKI